MLSLLSSAFSPMTAARASPPALRPVTTWGPTGEHEGRSSVADSGLPLAGRLGPQLRDEKSQGVFGHLEPLPSGNFQGQSQQTRRPLAGPLPEGQGDGPGLCAARLRDARHSGPMTGSGRGGRDPGNLVTVCKAPRRQVSWGSPPRLHPCSCAPKGPAALAPCREGGHVCVKGTA